MRKILIIYHKEDNDGVFSGAICKQYLVNKLDIKESMIEAQGHTYGTLENLFVEDLADEYSIVIMTDISFDDYETMIELHKKFGTNLIWFDHHAPIIKTSIQHNFDDIIGERATDMSALMLCFKYFHDPFGEKYKLDKVPNLFRILSGWDSWSYVKEGYTLDYVRDINVAVTNKYKIDFDTVYKFVDKLMNAWEACSWKEYSEWESQVIDNLEREGKLISEYNKNQWANTLNNYGDMTWKLVDGDVERSVCALFYQCASTSQMFAGCKAQNGVVFKHNPDGSWAFSLYNVNNDDHSFHCGDFLKRKYHGGGHEGAAGAQLTEKQFLKLLKSKIL